MTSKDKLSLVINAHTRAIACIAVNHDGTKVATASTKVMHMCICKCTCMIQSTVVCNPQLHKC